MRDVSAEAWSLTARWMFPVAGPPLPGGVVTCRGERIVAIETFAEDQVGAESTMPAESMAPPPSTAPDTSDDS